MVQIFKASAAKKANKSKLAVNVAVQMDSLDFQGRGVGRHKGKVYFVDGALPKETVLVDIKNDKTNFVEARLNKVLTASDNRVKPLCSHYQQCGGCQLQHLSSSGQLAAKQQMVMALLAKHGWGNSLNWQAPVSASNWHYRNRARLAAFFDKQTKQLKLGFRQKQSKKIVDIKECTVLQVELAQLLVPLNQLLNQLSTKTTISHVELNRIGQQSIVAIRCLAVMNPADLDKLTVFAQQQACIFQLSEGKEAENKQTRWLGEPPNLTYTIGQCELTFGINDFTQVNGEINQRMVAQALDWLALNKDDAVVDLFSGLGNFTLPIASHVKSIVGIEGVQTMVDKANLNAQQNQLSNVKCLQADLFHQIDTDLLASASKIILDPARAGAEAVCQTSHLWQAKAVLYVSCDPNSLARDGAHLLKAGYQVDKIGLLDMFPHTSHVETLVLFKRSE